MEYSQINTITKFGPDDYSLWTLTLPREKIHEIRQKTLPQRREICVTSLKQCLPAWNSRNLSVTLSFLTAMACVCFRWIWARISRTGTGITAVLSGEGVRTLWQSFGTS